MPSSKQSLAKMSCLIALLLGIWSFGFTVSAVQAVTVTVDARQPGRPINPLFFGVCPMFWMESDAAMADGVIERHLAALPCRLLRYPGGTDSDVYVWDTQRLHEKRWPFKDGPKTMDTDEFIALCRRVKAEPLLCVNTEISHFASLERGVKLAVDWVRYCNIEKGYGVKYWEIGNEPYYHTRFNAEEYARLFLAYAKAMRAVDPAIKIAAVGEWNVDYPGVKELIPPDRRLHAKELEYQLETGRWELGRELESLRTWTNGTPWWPALLKIAGREMDFASIHWYFSQKELPGMTFEIGRLRELLRRNVPGKEIPVALTEWSLHEHEQVYGMERALCVAEAVGRLLDGGVEMATYWPLRCGGNHEKKGLLESKSKTPTPNYVVMQQMAASGGAQLLSTTCSETGLYHFASRSVDERTICVFLVNRSPREFASVRLSVPGFSSAEVRVTTLSASGPNSAELNRTEKTLRSNDSAWAVAVPPWALIIARMNSL